MVNIVITGTNRGIGLALAQLYTQQEGAQVFALCRQSNDALRATGCTILENVDVGDDASIEAMAQHLSDLLDGQSIDILINNAGILLSDQLDNLDFSKMRQQFEINTIGPLRVTRALMPLLREGSKVGIVSSRVGSITDNGSGNNYGYRISKTAVNMAGANLAHDLKPRGITVILLHPGYVATDMVNHAGPTPPDESARGLIERIEAIGIEQTGSFWHAEGYELPW